MAYTSHGHHIPKTVRGVEQPPFVARCGGVGICYVCNRDAADYLEDAEKPTLTPEEVQRNIEEIGRAVTEAFQQFTNALITASEALNTYIQQNNTQEK